MNSCRTLSPVFFIVGGNFLDNVRLAATKILYNVAAKGAWANVELAQTIRNEKFSPLKLKKRREVKIGCPFFIPRLIDKVRRVPEA